MKHLFFFLLAFLLLASCRMHVVFHVTDKTTGEPLADVSTVQQSSGKGNFTNSEGYIAVEQFKRREIFVFKKAAYYGETLSFAHYKKGDTLSVSLTPDPDPDNRKLLLIEDSVNAAKWALEDAAYPIRVTDTISVLTDIQAEFPGGQPALTKWLSTNIRYPQHSLEEEEEGKVYVRFIVEADGNVTHVEVVRGVSYHIDREARRACRNMPNWKPGYQNGKPIRSYFHLPVNFVLQ